MNKKRYKVYRIRRKSSLSLDKKILIGIALLLLIYLLGTGIAREYDSLTIQDKEWVKDRFDDVPWN